MKIGLTIHHHSPGYGGPFTVLSESAKYLYENQIDVRMFFNQNQFTNFSLNLKNSELNKWLGPYESAFGHHIIYITNFKEGFYPELTSVLQKVEVDYMLNQKDIALKSFLNKIRAEYKIYINPDLQI